MPRPIGLLFAAIMVIVILADPSYAGPDITGWANLKFGTTYAHAAKLFQLGDLKPSNSGKYFARAAKPIKIQGLDFKLTLSFDSQSAKGKLIRAMLGHRGKSRDLYTRFTKILKSIIGQYGKPTKTRRRRSGMIREWLTPSGQLMVVLFRVNANSGVFMEYIVAGYGSDN